MRRDRGVRGPRRPAREPVSEYVHMWEVIEEEVFENLYAIWNESQDGNMGASPSSVKRAIREKILESYHNGQKAKGGTRV